MTGNPVNFVKGQIFENYFYTDKGKYPLDEDGFLSFSASAIRQGDIIFYTLSLWSDVLAALSFVIQRSENKEIGFQRYLNENKAKDIADYIDSGGTIPTSIIISAQASTAVHIDRRKSIKFKPDELGFLVIDGQHRVFGFHLAKTRIRVPVVIYMGLSKQMESKIFIDINSKQTMVPNELMLDISKLAGIEENEEALLRELFDTFETESDSALLGLLSSHARVAGKISRVTFNEAFRPIIDNFEDSSYSYIYSHLNPYLNAFIHQMKINNSEIQITKPNTFKTAVQIFPEVFNAAARISNSSNPTSSDYTKSLEILFKNSKISSMFKGNITAYRKAVSQVRDIYSQRIKI